MGIAQHENQQRWGVQTVGRAVNDPASPDHIYGALGAGEIAIGLDFDGHDGKYSACFTTKVDETIRGKYIIVVERGCSVVEVWARDRGFQPRMLQFTQNTKVMDRLREVFTHHDLDTRLLCGVVAEAQTVWNNHMQEEIDRLEEGDIHHHE